MFFFWGFFGAQVPHDQLLHGLLDGSRHDRLDQAAAANWVRGFFSGSGLPACLGLEHFTLDPTRPCSETQRAPMRHERVLLAAVHTS